MTTRRLLLDSIRHYWRTHLGVILGSALAALVLTGALMVGDSVKATLRSQAEARVGKIGEALLCGERFVPWPREVEKRPSVVARTFAPGPDAAGVLMLSGTAARSDGKARANKVQIVGVDDAFWKLSPSGASASPPATSTPREAPIPPRTQAQQSAASPTANVAGGDASAPSPRAPLDGLAINERLAAQLGVKAGDEIRLRMEKPSAISKDAPLSGAEDAVVTFNARVARVVGDADFGRFALASGQVPPHTAFVPLAVLQEKLGEREKVNVFLKPSAVFSIVSDADKARIRRSQIVSRLTFGIMQPETLVFTPSGLVLDDIELTQQFGDEVVVRELPDGRGMELRSPRVFLDPAVVLAARKSEESDEHSIYIDPPLSPEDAQVASVNGYSARIPIPGPKPPPGLDSLTYFVNELRVGDGSDAKAKATPYSMVTAIDAAASGFVNPKLADDEIQITRWLADDLGVAPGAKVTLKYFVMGERRQLVEKARTFTVAAPILEMDTPQLQTDADGKDSWMPDFPNVPDKKSFGKWKPGFDFDATRVRKQDEAYWEKYRGTPKAFVTLKTGQELWGNRWGNLTSIRYPAGTKREQVERIAAFIDPAALGFRTVNLREQALAATNAPVDFGELFVYFSFFLIAAAAVLTGLLFTFTIEQRAAEAGLLLAVGWPVKKVRRLFLREGFVLALIGSLVGALLAALYTKGVLHALAGVWGGATGGTRFVFAPSAVTMAIGVLSGVFVALFAMWLASRRLFKMEAAALLTGAVQHEGAAQTRSRVRESAGTLPGGGGGRGSARALTSAATCVIAALALAVFAKGNSGAFFGAGALLLIAGCLFALARLRQMAGGTGAESIAQLGARNISRRRGRSLATIAVLASGVFMVIAVDSFRKGAPEDSTRRGSGTGGFAFIGESSAPIYEDLNSAKGRDAYALDDKLMSGVRVVQMRVRDGDDASCLNLNRAVQPRILGANFAELDQLGDEDAHVSGSARASRAVSGASPETPGHGRTSVADTRTTTPDAPGEGAGRGARGRARSPFSLVWSEVAAKDAGAVPGVVDANTLQWAMQKKIGDVIEIPGERGAPARIQIAATVSGSVLQGLVIIPERDFTAKFPNTAGYRFFLVDCPREKADAVREHLTRQLGDRGLELTPAVKRLAEFNEVENTYLSIFQVLGGLGMLLGSAGLGIVVARNVFERRREFGLLEAVGFTPQTLRSLVFAEHRWLIVGALGIGAVSALTAVWPRLSAQAAHFPWRGILTLLAGMALLGAFWAWLATRLALRRSQLPALRTE
jgi:ABC-type lipoprotein release transport system permease subunit